MNGVIDNPSHFYNMLMSAEIYQGIFRKQDAQYHLNSPVFAVLALVYHL